MKNTYLLKNHCNLKVIFIYSLASNFVDSGGTCNLQIEGQEDADVFANTSIKETDTDGERFRMRFLTSFFRFFKRNGMHTLKYTCENNLFLFFNTCISLISDL